MKHFMVVTVPHDQVSQELKQRSLAGWNFESAVTIETKDLVKGQHLASIMLIFSKFIAPVSK
jgi:hypothetical protein